MDSKMLNGLRNKTIMWVLIGLLAILLLYSYKWRIDSKSSKTLDQFTEDVKEITLNKSAIEWNWDAPVITEKDTLAYHISNEHDLIEYLTKFDYLDELPIPVRYTTKVGMIQIGIYILDEESDDYYYLKSILLEKLNKASGAFYTNAISVTVYYMSGSFAFLILSFMVLMIVYYNIINYMAKHQKEKKIKDA